MEVDSQYEQTFNMTNNDIISQEYNKSFNKSGKNTNISNKKRGKNSLGREGGK